MNRTFLGRSERGIALLRRAARTARLRRALERGIARFALGGLGTVGVLGCGPAADPGAWIAEVGGHRIPLERLAEASEGMEGQTEEAREKALLIELDRLVREQVILNRAAELEIEVNDAEVDRFLERLQSSDPVDPTFREEVRREMLLDRTAVLELAVDLEVPESAVAFHYAEHRARYVEAPQVQVRHIVVQKSGTADTIREQLRAEESRFEALAREHGLGPEAHQGGLLKPYEQGELPEVFDRAFDLDPGEISEVVHSPYGYHIFRLERRIEGRERTLGEVGEEIRGELQRTRFVSLREDWLRDLQRGARVRINEAALESIR